jgi:hypothetical protein
MWFFTGGCTTLPSCAWGKYASPRTFALGPQTGERVYPLDHAAVYPAVKAHFEQRGYPLSKADVDLIATEPYAERPFTRLLGIRYHWEVGVRKMDWLNTAVTPRLYVHEEGAPPRLLSPSLWPEPYRDFYYRLEADLRETHAASHREEEGRSSAAGGRAPGPTTDR